MAITDRALASRGFIRIRVKDRGPTPRHLVKHRNQIMKASLSEGADYHHQEHIPDRFTEEGGRRLGFRRRSQRYTNLKFRLFRHRKPNVWTGSSRRAAKRFRKQATTKSVKMTYNARKLNFHSGAQELRKSDKKEAKAVSQVIAKQFDTEMDKLN